MSIVLLLSVVSNSFARASIKEEHQVPNVLTGYCGWCALETLGRHAGITKLEGLVEEKVKTAGYYVWDGYHWVFHHDGGTYQVDLRNELKKRNIKFKHIKNGSYDYGFLEKVCKNGLGAVVALKPKDGEKNGHAVVVVDINEKQIEIVDSNHISKVKYMSREKFEKRWKGGAISLDLVKAKQ